MAPYETLYGRRSKSLTGWLEVWESGLIGPELVYHALEKVKNDPIEVEDGAESQKVLHRC